MKRARALAVAAVLVAATAPAVFAQDDDSAIDAAHPDVTVLSLPTTLPLPPGGFLFRVTHRFTRPLGQGDFGDKAADLFGLDSSSTVGMELRVGIARGLQAGVYRLSDRTIDLFAQQTLLRQGGAPVGLAVKASVEGQDNFGENHAPQAALVLSRTLGERGALYLVPAWTGNANAFADVPGESDSNVTLGFGVRYGFSDAYYVAAEVVPVLSGYKGLRANSGGTSAPHISIGLERHAGGHVFQLNASNSTGTTPAGVARGQDAQVDDWYIGFNLSRKFY